MNEGIDKAPISGQNNASENEHLAPISKGAEPQGSIDAVIVAPKSDAKVVRRVKKVVEVAEDGEALPHAASDESAATHTAVVEQVPPAPAGAAVGAGGQVAGGVVTGSVAAGATVAAVSPLVIGGVVAGVVAVSAVAAGSGGSQTPPPPPPPPPPPANGAPVATADVAQAVEGGAPVTGSVATNDRDPDSDTLRFALAEPVAGLTLNADGSYAFDTGHAAYQDLGVGETRVVTARYTVSDGRGGSATSTLTITVTGTNDAPTVVGESFEATEDGAIATGSVATNDSDVDGDTIRYVLTKEVAGLTFNPDGSYEFDPSNPAYQGISASETREVIAEYEVSDGKGGVTTARLLIEIQGRNDAPVADEIELSVREDDAIIQGSFADHARDPDDEADLTYAIVGEVPAGLTFNPDTGAYSFDPGHEAYQGLPEGRELTIEVRYTVTDEHGEITESTMTITVIGQADDVNAPPVVVDDTLSAREGDGQLGGSVASNDHDPDGDNLVYILTKGVDGLTLDPNGSYTFDPADPAYQNLKAGETRVVTAEYLVEDGQGGSVASTLTITVTGTNDGPTASNSAETVNEDDGIFTGSVHGSVRDPDAGDVLRYSTTTSVDGLTFNTNGTYSLDLTLPKYQSLPKGATLTIPVFYTVTDESGVEATATLTITVTGTNDKPEAGADVAEAIEDGVWVQGSVADNDSDADDDAWLTYTPAGDLPAGLEFFESGEYRFNPGHEAYQHLEAGKTHDVVFRYIVTDEHGESVEQTLTITVTGRDERPNSPPVVGDDDDVAVSEGQSEISGSVADNDTDPDGDQLTYTLIGGYPGLSMSTSGDYTFDATHPYYQILSAGHVMTLSVDYVVSDGFGGYVQKTLYIKVTGTNDAPVAAPDVLESRAEGSPPVSGSVATNDMDPDELPQLKYFVAPRDMPAGLTFDDTGAYTFDPNDEAYDYLKEGEVLKIDVPYTVRDEHGATDTAILTITLVGKNDSPVASADVRTADEGDAEISGSVLGNDHDPDGPLPLKCSVVGGTLPDGLTLEEDGQYTFDPTHPSYQHLGVGDVETIRITYVVQDGDGGSSQSTLTITLTGTNDAPKVTTHTAEAIEDGAVITGTVKSAGDDPDDNADLTYTVVGAPAGFTLDPETGVYSFDPRHDAYQHISRGVKHDVVITYTVTDEHGESATCTLTITVTGTNDAPRAAPDSVTTDEDAGTLTGSVATNDEDVDDDRILTYTTDAVHPGLIWNNGAYSLDLSQAIYQNLPEGEELVLRIPYTVKDQYGETATAELTITVTGKNDQPVAVADAAVAVEGEPFFNGTVANDTDPDRGASLTYHWPVNQDPVAGLTFNEPLGTYTFNPRDPAYDSLGAGDSEVIEVRYIVRDEKGAETIGILRIAVSGTNDAPTAVSETIAATEGGSPISGSVRTNDSDPDRDTTLTYEWNSVPPGLTVNADGTYSFDPNDRAYQGLKSGQTTIIARYTVVDGDGGRATATLRITLTGVNDAPEGSHDEYILPVNGSLQIAAAVGVLSNDRDAERDAVTVVLDAGPANGTLTLNPDGSFTYTPNAGFKGEDSFTYIPTDGVNQGERVTVRLIVAPVDQDGITFATEGAEFGYIGPETLVNTTTTGAQFESRMTALEGGGFIVTWVDTRTSGEIFAQRFDAAGNKIGPEFIVNTTTSGPQSTPSVAALPGGGFVVLWDDVQANQVRARRYNADGTPASAEFIVNTQSQGDQEEPDITVLSNGGFVITWTDRGGVTETGAGVRAQIYDANGSPVGGEVLVNTAQAGTQAQSSVTATAGGGFIVTWKDTQTQQVKFQRFNAAGDKLGGEIAINQVQQTQSEPDIIALADGRFVVMWTEGTSTRDAVCWQVFDASGQPVSPATRLLDVADAIQEDASITALTDGGFVVVWADSTAGNGDGQGSAIMAQRFDASGAKVGAPFVVNLSVTGHQTLPHVTALPEGGFAVTWTDASGVGGDSSSTGIKVQVFGDRSPFDAVEQEALNLKGKIEIDRDTGSDVISLVITVGHGIIEVSSGTSGAMVSGNGTGLVTITGTRDQINALLGTDPASVVRYTTVGESPPSGTPLGIVVYGDDGAEIADGNRILTIREVNDKPVLGADEAVAVNEGEDLLFGTVATNDLDPDGDALIYTVTTNVSGFRLNPDGSYTFDPNHPDYASLAEGATRTLTVQYQVIDGRGQISTASLVIHLTGTNDAPIASSTSRTVTDAQAAVSGNLGGSDVDAGDLARLTARLVGDAPAGFRLTGGRGYEFDPSPYLDLGVGEQVIVEAWYVLTDPQGAESGTAVLRITVTGTAAGPAATLTSPTDEPLEPAATELPREPANHVLGEFWIGDLEFSGGELIPIGDHEVGAAQRATAAERLSPVVIAEGVDPAWIFESAEANRELIISADAYDFGIPDQVFVLTPLDPLLHGGSAVIV